MTRFETGPFRFFSPAIMQGGSLFQEDGLFPVRGTCSQVFVKCVGAGGNLSLECIASGRVATNQKHAQNAIKFIPGSAAEPRSLGLKNSPWCAAQAGTIRPSGMDTDTPRRPMVQFAHVSDPEPAR